VRVRGAGGGRVSIAWVACYRPGNRPHLFYVLCAYRRCKGEAKGFHLDRLPGPDHRHPPPPVSPARSIANFTAADLDGLVRLVKRKLRKIQYPPNVCRPVTGVAVLAGPGPGDMRASRSVHGYGAGSQRA
jgi:hypothetical protein